MTYTNNSSLEKAAEYFDKNCFIEGAKHLVAAYYECEKSKEILGYFDEVFFKPNIQELERIYNLNVKKINNISEKQVIKFDKLPYCVIPIDVNQFYIYDKGNKNIITKNFTDEQDAVIEFCTDENVMILSDIEADKYIKLFYPKFTIIIPTYNQEKYLVEAIDSCLKQDYPNLDILVGDDCSTDGTEKVMKIYLKKDERIRYVRNNDNIGGEKNTRELLYGHTTSIYGMIFNHDDYFIKNDYISNAVNRLIENPDLSLVWANCKIKYENTGKFESTKFKNNKVIKGIEYFLNYETNNYPHITGMLTTVFDFQKLKSVGSWGVAGRAHSIFLDTILYLKLMLVGDIGFIDEEASVYRSHKDSISYNFHTKYDEIVIKEFELMKTHVFNEKLSNSNNLDIWINNRISRYIGWRWSVLWNTGKRNDAIELLIDIKQNYPVSYRWILDNV